MFLGVLIHWESTQIKKSCQQLIIFFSYAFHLESESDSLTLPQRKIFFPAFPARSFCTCIWIPCTCTCSKEKCKISCPRKYSWYLFCSTPTFDIDPLDSLPRPRDEEFMLACQCKSPAVKQMISPALCQSDIFHKTDTKYPEFTGHSFLFIHRIPS